MELADTQVLGTCTARCEGSIPSVPTMTLYMGHTKNQGKRHYVKITTGFETKALCGAKVVTFISDNVGNPIPYKYYWSSNYHSCQHCEARLAVI